MATPQSQLETSLQISRTFPAPRDRVFHAWTDAKQFAMWFHPTAEYTTVITRLDLRVGGAYRLEMHHKDGGVHKLTGTYEQIQPPEKLVFTWKWQREDALPESLVTVEFRDLGGSTEVNITHVKLFNAEDREKHNHGWIGCLVQLQSYLA
jgi:glutathione S-transferase